MVKSKKLFVPEKQEKKNEIRYTKARRNKLYLKSKRRRMKSGTDNS